MGRIKTTYIKRKTRELVEKYGEKFTGDFETNKKVLGEIATIKSKKIRNVIAGYLTRLIKKAEDF